MINNNNNRKEENRRILYFNTEVIKIRHKPGNTFWKIILKSLEVEE